MDYIYESHRIYVKNEEGKVIVNATFPFITHGVVNVDHTYVDPSLRGQGIASQLMHEVHKHAKSLNYKVVATCPYAVVWFKKHPDLTDIIDDEVQAKLAPECQV
ncbi:GNAT family N-acetyltransferase [Peloplasma aerotolerans]|uniref:GNAT family N-acetyltransferase n=1 Tax=Peloplasma aerotolerans TaxID=3044389 RepID=A0AAW6U4A7_9MOLU|nr:GNAT family N-acetyltransferase [Mariniplasma sp. M4Ah]MDI6452747.1 GNAT family N-acetyltransferase [Mariniplasma sp. M4Ah]